MMKLRTLKLSAKRREYTHMKSNISHTTRWGSTLYMLTRYAKIRQYLPHLKDESLKRLFLSKTQNEKLDTLLVHLQDLDRVTKASQYETTTIFEAREMFDAVIQCYPELEI